MTDANVAKDSPELAVLSSIAHGHGDVQTAVKIALSAADATLDLDEDTRALYCDMVLAALSEAARKAFEMIPETYKFQSPPYHEGKREGKLEGKLEGRLEGEANAVILFLEARGLSVTSEQRERILNCRDPEALQRWVKRAVSSESVAELLDN